MSFMSDFSAPSEVLRALGARARQLRVLRELQQSELAARAGVGVATLQRFEKTGRASIENVFRIAIALQADSAFARLFELPKYTSFDEALDRPARLARQRVRRAAR